MLRRPNGSKSLRITALGAIAAACFGAAVVRATPPAQSRPASTTSPSPHPPDASQPAGDFQILYQTRLAELKPNDAEGLYSLAVLCSSRQRPDLAADLSRKILASWPAHTKAKALLRAATVRMAATSRTTPTSRPAMSQPALTVAGVLTPEAINRIRFAEFLADDMTDRPRVKIAKIVLQEFLELVTKAKSMNDDDLNQFNRSDNDDKLRWIIKKSDAQRYVDNIQLNSEPRSMATFRQKIWPIINHGCAAPNCHGGEKAGHLAYVLPTTYAPVMPTNFYIVSRFEAPEGLLVNRQHPEASLLLQFGLPPDQSEWKHPVASLPTYSGPNDPKYQIVLDWIRQLRTPCPDYGITDRMWQPFPNQTTAPKPDPDQ
jgi:hypothetical protein